jgi:hypothetical protein
MSTRFYVSSLTKARLVTVSLNVGSDRGFPVRVNVQVFVLFPPLEHAPDQMTSRPFVALSVVAAPVANDAVPLLPTLTRQRR